MNKSIIFEFPYFHEAFNEEVIVEVDAVMNKAAPCADSDWDARDYLEILSASVFHKGDALDIDIPHETIYSEILSQIRKAEVFSAFSEENGEF